MGRISSIRDVIRSGRIVRLTALCSFFLFFFISLLRMQVSNEDFWWHLATGKYIAENRSLPQTDPFLYTTSDTPSERKSFLLRGYWLSEVIFYRVYSLWDLKGIIVLRALLLLSFLFFVFLTIRKQGVHDMVALVTVSAVFWYTLIAEGERPQIFTFLIFSAIYYFLEDYRKNRSKKVYLVPVLVLVLSNMHTGYIICFVLLSVYLAGESIRYFSTTGRKDSAAKGILLIWVLSFILSYLNPNRWDIFANLISTGFFTRDTMHVVEMLPTFKLYSMKMIPVDYPYLIFLISSMSVVFFIRKTGIVQVLLLIAFTLMSISAYRFLMFYLCVAPPIVARVTVFLKDRSSFAWLTGPLREREGLIRVFAGISGVLLVINASISLSGFKFKGNELFFLPKGAADFLGSEEINGNMFNEYGFGGYLTWRLFPEKKAFVDTRSLEPHVTFEYNAVAFASEGRPVSWKSVMNKYGISYVVMRPLWQNGKIIPVVERLLDSDEWALVYTDHLSMIFVKRGSGNGPVIKRHEKTKEHGLNTIIAQASAWAMTPNQINPNYFITLGKTFFKLGRTVDSEKAFLMAYSRDPENPETKEWLQRLRQVRTGGEEYK